MLEEDDINVISGENFKRCHAIEWFVHQFEEKFAIRYLYDSLAGAHLAIKLRGAEHLYWAPVIVRVFVYRNDNSKLSGNAYNRRLFVQDSTRNHILVHIGLSNLSSEVETNICNEYGRALGDNYPLRFRNWPIAFCAIHSQFRDFQGTRVTSTRNFTDPTAHVWVSSANRKMHVLLII